MAAADRKITYTAAEVAELIRPLTQSVEALQKENAELKQKLEHMNEILANAQRARFGQSSEKKRYVLSEDQMSLFNEAEICQDSKAEEPTEETLTVKAHARKKKRTIDEQENITAWDVLQKCLSTYGCKFIDENIGTSEEGIITLPLYMIAFFDKVSE